ncbi:O-antigen ligase family protein [uncultured Bacteroides sp.]|uniref:O-antigen ligase family protein n=1 Tax=uncultured Bacteroides sp. TaxID=162156 RepID=UPI0025DAD37F|nr:O-antigen ligase family protein [uncultured Bacteroides sp.]
MKIESRQLRNDASAMLMFVGTIGLLSTVCAYSSAIPAGDVSYQWLWCGWGAVLFAICIWLSALLSVKRTGVFHDAVIWGIILMGGVEAVLGLCQIYGLGSSNHSLYAATGSFYNPGPYSGYLALAFPMALYEWLWIGATSRNTWKRRIGYYLSAEVLCLFLCVLPAGMSRSAWLAALCSGGFVGGMHYSWGARLRNAWQAHRTKVVFAGLLIAAVLAAGSSAIYYMKEDSAKGRWFMWKISSLAVAREPLVGHGAGNFVSAYGQSQEDYFCPRNIYGR